MIVKVALLTSAIYVVLALLVQLGLLLSARFFGGASITATRLGWWLFFAGLWLVAFGIAWQFAPMSRSQ